VLFWPAECVSDQLQRVNDEDKWEVMQVDLEELQEKRRDLLAVMDKLKKYNADAKQRLKVEKYRPENSKAFGQPVCVTINDVVKRHGIDQGARFGRALDGTGCRKLLSAATNIIEEVKGFILRLPREQ
jgi:hypothetical protein